CTDSLQAVHVTTSGTPSPSFTVTTVRAGYSSGQGSSPPILVGGVLWNLDRGAALLLGFNPSTRQPLFSAPLAEEPNPFAAPAAGAGQVFVPAGSALSAFAFNGGADVPPPSTPTLAATSTPTSTPTTAPAPARSGGGGGGGGGGGSRPASGGGTTVNV